MDMMSVCTSVLSKTTPAPSHKCAHEEDIIKNEREIFRMGLNLVYSRFAGTIGNITLSPKQVKKAYDKYLAYIDSLLEFIATEGTVEPIKDEIGLDEIDEAEGFDDLSSLDLSAADSNDELSSHASSGRFGLLGVADDD